MTDALGHVHHANRSRRTLSYLLEKVGDHPEWVAVVAFYAALQTVDAVLIKVRGVCGTNHDDRNSLLRTDRRLHQIWTHYRPLYAESRQARYDPGWISGDMTPAKVESELVNHRLTQLQRSAKKLLGTKLAKELET